MTQVEKIAALRKRCTNLSTLGERILEARNLGTRLSELQRATAKLTDCISTVAILTKAGIAVIPPSSSVAQLRSTITKIRTRFSQTRTADALTKGQDWKVLLRDLPKVISELEEAVSQSWGAYAQQLFAGDAPSEVERTLAPTDANKAALAKYRAAYDQFARFRENLPTSAEEITGLTSAAKALKSVKFDYEVPASVRKFLEALPAGAPIALLTDEVRDWITQQGLNKRYQIVATSR